MFPNWLLLFFADFLVSWLCLLQRLAVITLAYSRKGIIRPRKLPRDFKWVFLSDFILAWGGGMVLSIRGFHQQPFNTIISRFFPAGRGHMMNLERCPVAIPLQASRAPRTDPPIVSVIPSIRTFPNAPRSHSVSARKGNSQVPKVRYRTRFDKDTEPINNNNTEVLSNKRAGEINDILDG